MTTRIMERTFVIHPIRNLCRRHLDGWSYHGHYPVHPPTPPWSHRGQRSRSWSLMIHSNPFPVPCQSAFPFLGYGKTLTLKIQCQSRGYGRREKSHSCPSIQLICSHIASHQSDQHFLRQRYFQIAFKSNSRPWRRSNIKASQWTQYPSNVLPFCFASIRPVILETWPIEYCSWQNASEILKKIAKKKSLRNCSTILPGNRHG